MKLPFVYQKVTNYTIMNICLKILHVYSFLGLFYHNNIYLAMRDVFSGSSSLQFMEYFSDITHKITTTKDYNDMYLE